MGEGKGRTYKLFRSGEARRTCSLAPGMELLGGEARSCPCQHHRAAPCRSWLGTRGGKDVVMIVVVVEGYVS